MKRTLVALAAAALMVIGVATPVQALSAYATGTRTCGPNQLQFQSGSATTNFTLKWKTSLSASTFYTRAIGYAGTTASVYGASSAPYWERMADLPGSFTSHSAVCHTTGTSRMAPLADIPAPEVSPEAGDELVNELLECLHAADIEAEPATGVAVEVTGEVDDTIVDGCVESSGFNRPVTDIAAYYQAQLATADCLATIGIDTAEAPTLAEYEASFDGEDRWSPYASVQWAPNTFETANAYCPQPVS